VRTGEQDPFVLETRHLGNTLVANSRLLLDKSIVFHFCYRSRIRTIGLLEDHRLHETGYGLC
jgi:hypothetical protein